MKNKYGVVLILIFFFTITKNSVLFAQQDVTGTGKGYHYYPRTFNVVKISNTEYKLEDRIRKINTKFLDPDYGDLYMDIDSDNNWDSQKHKPAVDVHWSAAQVYDFYAEPTFYNRLSYDGNQTPILFTTNAEGDLPPKR